MRSKPCGDPSMGLRWPWAERRGTQGPPWPCTDKAMSRALTLLSERSTYQSRAQRAAALILGQTPRMDILFLGACPRKKSLKNNVLEPRRSDLKISPFPETRVLTGDQNFLIFSKNT